MVLREAKPNTQGPGDGTGLSQRGQSGPSLWLLARPQTQGLSTIRHKLSHTLTYTHSHVPTCTCTRSHSHSSLNPLDFPSLTAEGPHYPSGVCGGALFQPWEAFHYRNLSESAFGGKGVPIEILENLREPSSSSLAQGKGTPGSQMPQPHWDLLPGLLSGTES